MRPFGRTGSGSAHRVRALSRIGRAAAAAALIVALVTPAATGVETGEATSGAPGGAPGGALGGATGGAAPPGAPSKSRVAQDVAWLSAKVRNGVHRTASGSFAVGAELPVAMLPSAKRLVTNEAQIIVEPPGSGVDDRGTYFVDANYWNFCAPGGATVAAYFFGSTRVTARPAGYFIEPYGPRTVRTYWASADTASGYATKGRAFLLYMAEQVFPPVWATPGLADFSYYPTTGATLPDTRDALNWEISGHSSRWASYYYAVQPAGGWRFSQAQLHTDVAWGIGYDNAPIVTAVNTAYLPNWSRSVGHTIVIVGYDDVAGTYTYLDTCGKLCNGSPGNLNGGVYSVGQSALYNAIAAWGTGYLY
jgi:hypothetical protein